MLQRGEATDSSADEGTHSDAQGASARDAEPTGSAGTQSLPSVCGRVSATCAAHPERLLGPQAAVSFTLCYL